MNQFLQEILSPQLSFEGANESDKFERFFCDLYRIEIFKPGLDLILTKLQEKDITFEVKIIKDWDTNLGCYLTEQNKIFNSVLGKFSRQVKKKIIIKNFKHNVLAHEMAHALEFESGINLGKEFNQCLSVDLNIPSIFAELKAKYGDDKKDESFAAKHSELNIRKADSIALNAQIKRLMFDALKAYKTEQFLSELFARYFELLALTRDVHGTGDFTSAQVMDFFVNTTNFITKIFNPKIQNQIDPAIANFTNTVVEEVHLEGPQKKFTDDVQSFFKNNDSKNVDGQNQRIENNSQKSFAKNVKSNAKWQAGWQQYQALEDKKDK